MVAPSSDPAAFTVHLFLCFLSWCLSWPILALAFLYRLLFFLPPRLSLLWQWAAFGVPLRLKTWHWSVWCVFCCAASTLHRACTPFLEGRLLTLPYSWPVSFVVRSLLEIRWLVSRLQYWPFPVPPALSACQLTSSKRWWLEWTSPYAFSGSLVMLSKDMTDLVPLLMLYVAEMCCICGASTAEQSSNSLSSFGLGTVTGMPSKYLRGGHQCKSLLSILNRWTPVFTLIRWVFLSVFLNQTESDIRRVIWPEQPKPVCGSWLEYSNDATAGLLDPCAPERHAVAPIALLAGTQ